MSTNLPPVGPGEPEYLDSQGGGTIPQPQTSGSGRRVALVAGGTAGLLAVVGAGAWVAWSFLSTGPQPAEALPASTIAYASVDLDPSGAQKIEALQTLRKFPAFKDAVGLESDDDVRLRIFEEIQQSSECEDLDYDADIEPWLGDRMAMAAVDTGKDVPAPIVVLQVSDEGAAEEGLAKLRDCGGEEMGWTIADGWALLGDSEDVVDDVAAEAADDALADDGDYTRWTDEAGDAGIATFYVAPAAGEMLAEQWGLWFGGMPEAMEAVPGDEAPRLGDSLDADVPDEAVEALKDFGGMAATVRFDDGSLELEVAADSGDAEAMLGSSDDGAAVLATLPEDTAAAFGAGFSDGWFADLIEQVAPSEGMGADELMREISEESGLDLPEDAETLAGESAALAVGPDLDLDAFDGSSDGSDLPVGLKVRGDAEAIESVLDKLRPQLPGAEELLGSDSDGDLVAVSPDDDYRAALLDDGGLGDTKAFENVVREADDAAAVLFVNFDAGDEWLANLIGEEDADAADNVRPLEGLGISGWLDGDVAHTVVRITTD